MPSPAFIPCPEVRELPTGETGRPKSGQMGSAKRARSTGNPLKTASWSFFRLAGNLQPNYDVSRYSLPISDRCRLTGVRGAPER